MFFAVGTDECRHQTVFLTRDHEEAEAVLGASIAYCCSTNCHPNEALLDCLIKRGATGADHELRRALVDKAQKLKCM